MNLYGFVGNDGVNQLDWLGLEECALSEIYLTRAVSSLTIVFPEVADFSSVGSVAMTTITNALSEAATTLGTSFLSTVIHFKGEVTTSCQICECIIDADSPEDWYGNVQPRYEWVEYKSMTDAVTSQRANDGRDLDINGQYQDQNDFFRHADLIAKSQQSQCASDWIGVLIHRGTENLREMNERMGHPNE